MDHGSHNKKLENKATADDGQKSDLVSAPSISLLKGGGAIRGMGEKFTANPVTGTGSMSVPIATSPGRAGFGPQLSLSYDSGSGNSPFGLGWNLSLPAITRKTDKGLPKYLDSEESDVFILSGAEDLVPLLVKSGDQWVSEPESERSRIVDNTPYVIQHYCPRVDGLFARIERWTNQTNPSDIFWRSISKDNITTWYGKTTQSRIVDPDDSSRIFTWLISESYDDKGNVIVYGYKSENSEQIDLSRASEQNRTELNRSANRHLKYIRYGNRITYLPKLLEGQPWPTPPAETAIDGSQDWYFEVVFDYGEHNLDAPRPNDSGSWNLRPDFFSTYRAGFEVRNYRLCRRVLMFHHFPEELGTPDYLVRSTDFEYSENTVASFITRISQSGYVRHPDSSEPTRYLKKSLPPLEFEYSRIPTNEEFAGLIIQTVDSESLENLPGGLDGLHYQWVDLDGEGLSGILTEQGGEWYYKRNLSPFKQSTNDGEPPPARFASLEAITKIPARRVLGTGRQQLLDLAGNGQLDLVEFDEPTPGFYERTDDEDWTPFRPFISLPNLNWQDRNLRFVDLTGDGHADVLITEDQVLTWYPSLAESGFGPATKLRQALDEEKGPRLVFADAAQSIYLADLSGDGLTDLVRIRNGEICYWPNLGYGRFGAKVCMDNAPWFDTPNLFEQKRIRLADIDGSGVTDIVYLHSSGVRIYFNQSGNAWSDAVALLQFPPVDDLASVQVLDFLGNGTACLLWSSPLPGNTGRCMRYIDLMNGQKPHLLVKTNNNLGAETTIRYAPSTQFYLKDKYAGKPWITRLPFPVHCVEKVTVKDKWRKTEFSTSYSYHHGYFDGIEREFRGFGRVEQVDVEDYGTFAAGNATSPYITDDQRLYQPPVKTITWFHTGAAIRRDKILKQFENEYFPRWFEDGRPGTHVLGGFQENRLPEPDLAAQNLTADEWREALRACKGMVLRQESYELDVDDLQAPTPKHTPVRLFSAATHNCHIQRLQPQAGNRHAVLLVTESEAITYHYELDLRPDSLQPDPRIAHTLNLKTDAYGNVLQSVAVAYPRRLAVADATLASTDVARIRDVQRELHLTYTENCYTGDVIGDDLYRLRMPCEVLTYELTGILSDTVAHRTSPHTIEIDYFTLDELRHLRLSPEYPLSPELEPRGVDVEEIAYHQLPDRTTPQKRCVEHVRMLFFNDELNGPRPFRNLGAHGLLYETYMLALTDGLLGDVFGDKLTAAWSVINNADVSGYLGGTDLAGRFPGLDTTGQYWRRSGITGFEPDAAEHFFLPERYTDPFGNITRVTYAHDLLVDATTDALGNKTEVTRFDYRVLALTEIRDINGNLSEVVFDALGLPTAMAVKGKGAEADDLASFNEDLIHPDPVAVAGFFNADAYDEAQAITWLGNATARHLYHFGEVHNADGSITWGVHPACACGIVREQHVRQLRADEISPLQAAFEYTDGLGSVLVKKIQAEPERDGDPLRWIASGKTVLNNKGKPVKQYEPYFSSSGHRFEEPREEGVTPVIYYDAAGRTVRTEAPDGSYSRVEFSPWHTTTYDANDTVREPRNAWYAAQHPLEPDRPLPVNLLGESLATPEQRAAWLAAQHANTPGLTVLDSLGRDVVAIAHNRAPDDAGIWHEARYLTFTKLDAESKPLWIRDARRNLVMQYVRPVPIDPPGAISNTAEPTTYTPAYDIAGNLLFQHSMDGGDRWMLNDAAGKPMLAWDFNERQTDGGAVGEQRVYATDYDALRRPTAHWLAINGEPRRMIERYEYRDALNADGTPNSWFAEDQAANLLGQLVRHYDPSGLVETVRRDFNGNVLETRRTLASAYDTPVIDWSGDPAAGLEAETWAQITEYDALNRMTRQYQWHHPEPEARVAVYEPRYNERGLLAGEDLVIRATKTDGGYREVPRPAPERPAERTRAILAISYDAKGQKQRIDYGNRTTTRYDYDPQTFRLRQLRTTRPGYDPDFPAHHSSLRDDQVLQQLGYTYDPVGNITEIVDEAYKPVFFANQEVEPRSRYTYDALYRLIEASGREHANVTGAPGQFQNTPDHTAPLPIPGPGALRNYTQRYRYDAVGNIGEMSHSAGPTGSWTRSYEYATDSNRLLRTWTGSSDTDAVVYRYDTHGSMLNLANVPEEYRLRWDYRDMIQSVNLGGGGWAYYQYEAGKERTRKVIISGTGNDRWERLYLGGMEVYRRYVSGAMVEEIETHPLFVGEQRALIVEDVLATRDADLGVGARFRYQYGNHLGSACVELDEAAAVITYEEYHPYGTTAYLAGRSLAEVSLKRYRYTGKERDTETGLNYHSARYYLPWLGRWGSCDPISLIDGINRYTYATGNPLRLNDRQGTQSQSPSPLEEEANSSNPQLHTTFGPPHSVPPQLSLPEAQNRVCDPELHRVNRSEAPPPISLTPPPSREMQFDPDPLIMIESGVTVTTSELAHGPYLAGRQMTRSQFLELSRLGRSVPFGDIAIINRLRAGESISSVRSSLTVASQLWQGVEAIIQQRYSNMGVVYGLRPSWLLPPRTIPPEREQQPGAIPPRDLADRIYLPGINQQPGRVDDRSGQNCGPTAAATARTLLEQPTVVTRGGNRSLAELREFFFPEGQIRATRSQNEFERRFLAEDHGTVAIVDTFHYRDREHGHFIVAVNWHGRVYYADGQTGQWINPRRLYTFDAFMNVGRIQ